MIEAVEAGGGSAMNQTHVKKKSNPATDQTIKPNKRNRSNGSTQQTEPIKPTADQPIHRHRVPINPSNPPPISPSTTTEFPNQETKTLVLHKTKLHGRKREEAPPRAYRRERERSMSGTTFSNNNKYKKILVSQHVLKQC